MITLYDYIDSVLPDEIISHIFSYLSSKHLLRVVSLVSSRWSDLVLKNPIVWHDRFVKPPVSVIEKQEMIVDYMHSFDLIANEETNGGANANDGDDDDDEMMINNSLQIERNKKQFVEFFKNNRLCRIQIQNDHFWLHTILNTAQLLSYLRELRIEGLFQQLDIVNEFMDCEINLNHLHKLRVKSRRSDLSEFLVKRAPNLQVLYLSISPRVKSQRLEDLVLGLKSLKKLILRNWSFSSQFLVKVFSDLSLQSLRITDENNLIVKEDIVSQINQLPSLSHLRELEYFSRHSALLGDSVKCTEWRNPLQLTQLSCHCHPVWTSSLIQASQHTLTNLSLHMHVVLPADKIHFPNIKELKLSSSFVWNAVSFLVACSGSPLQQLTLNNITMNHHDGSVVTFNQFELPCLKNLTMNGVDDVLLLELILKGVTNDQMIGIYINTFSEEEYSIEKWRPLFNHLTSLRRFYGSVSLFFCLPQRVLGTMIDIDITSDGDADHFVLDHALLEYLVQCTSLKYLQLHLATEATNPDTLSMLLNALPHLESIHMQRLRLHDQFDISKLDRCYDQLQQLHIDLSKLHKADMDQFAIHFPNVKSIGSSQHRIPIDSFFQLLNSFRDNPRKKWLFGFVVASKDTQDDPFKIYSTQFNDLMLSLHMSLTLEQMMLICMSVGFESTYLCLDIMVSDDTPSISQTMEDLTLQALSLLDKVIDQIDDMGSGLKQKMRYYSKKKVLPRCIQELLIALV